MIIKNGNVKNEEICIKEAALMIENRSLKIMNDC
jgi:hypothetical protein